jgi:c(7)-type cytochrome triheme protein
MRLRSSIIVLAALACGVSGASALDLKDVTYDTNGGGKVVFSHKAHLKKKSEKMPNVSCKSCHQSAKEGKTHYTMADMEKGKSCGKCHTGDKAFSISKCTGCHKVKEISFKVKETGPVLFSHNKHLEKMQCGSCHTKLYATGPNKTVSMAEMEKGQSCGACHNGAKAFSIDKCNACHPNPKQVVFKVKETGPTVFSHTKHVARYKCSACHTKLYSIGSNRHASMAAMEKGKSCGACHNAKEAFAVSQCQKCHPVREINFKVANIADVKFSHKAHRSMYKCSSCHTRTFPLSTGNRPVTMSEMYQAKSCGACHDGKSAFSVHGNCDSCHVRS